METIWQDMRYALRSFTKRGEVIFRIPASWIYASGGDHLSGSWRYVPADGR